MQQFDIRAVTACCDYSVLRVSDMFISDDTDEITDNFTYRYFLNKSLTCSLCEPEGKKVKVG